MAGILQTEVDPQMVLALIAGDRAAQESLFKELSGPVFTMAKRVLQNQHCAEEVTQDTFVDVITKADTLRDPSLFTPWVRKIAVNHCYMRLRSPWYQRRDALDLVPDSGGEDEATERAVGVTLALAQLKQPARMIVWLYCVEGYTHDEIAVLFDKTISFSKSQLARALEILDTGESDLVDKRRVLN